jgi:predicted ribosome quality control (RQC) complex YloA/Tae2 family protein
VATEDEVKSFFENAIVELAGVEVLKLYDFKKTPSQNREQAFKNYRQIEEKKARLKERLQVLEKEVQKMEKEFNYQSQFNEKLKAEKLHAEKLKGEKLQTENIKEQKTIQFGGPGIFLEFNHSVPHKGLLEKAQAQGRRLELNDNLFAVIGKTAKDNLSILRKAQAWDLWLHLKDFPGAHAIITRPRNYEVSLAQIQKVATWVIKESFKKDKLVERKIS